MQNDRYIASLLFGFFASLIAALFTGYPLAYVAHHGLNPVTWPPQTTTPAAWLDLLQKPASYGTIINKYSEMYLGSVDAFPSGGRTEFAVLSASVLLITVYSLFRQKPVSVKRSASNLYGSTDWASEAELAKLSSGIEIGLDPETDKPVRVPVESNLLTIAPSRSGKSSGLVLPNLARFDKKAWPGPVVVIDPKGEAYRAARRRRADLGRRVRCLDPLGLVGGSDCWNPLFGTDPDDILTMQGVAQALLPRLSASESGAGQFFSNTAHDVLVAAFVLTIRNGHPDPVSAADLINDRNRFVELLEESDEPVCRTALGHIRTEEPAGSRDTGKDIISTASQATKWLLDRRMRRIVRTHSFEMRDLTDGGTDLFIVLPADTRQAILAPYVRWLLTDLFNAFRETKAAQRTLVIIDEAYALGRFEEILHGVSELPGHGVSLWTIWQSQGQILETYGPHGDQILKDNAEVINVFNLNRASVNEAEHWSRVIGEFTAEVESLTHDPKSKTPTRNVTLSAARLVPATDLPDFLRKRQVAILNGRSSPSRPLKLARTESYRDKRFSGLLDFVEPIDRA